MKIPANAIDSAAEVAKRYIAARSLWKCVFSFLEECLRRMESVYKSPIQLFKQYLSKDVKIGVKLNKDILVMVANFLVGIIVGYASFSLNNNMYSVGLMFIVGIMMKFVSEKILGEKKDFGWWILNGGLVYIFTWFVSFVLFFNLWGL